MTRGRLKMLARLEPQEPVESPGLRTASPGDREALAALLIAAYAGTLDDEGETPEQALAEIERTLGEAYGPYLEPCSFLVEAEGRVVAASLITRWSEAPLVAFVMVAPEYKGRGLRRAGAAAEHGRPGCSGGARACALRHRRQRAGAAALRAPRLLRCR